MRGPLVVLAAGLTAAVALANCKSSSNATPPPPGDKGAVAVKTPPPPPPPTGAGAEGASPGSAAPPVSGGSTEPDPSFELTTEVPAVAAAATSNARLVVHPAAGKKMNLDFPTSVTFAPPAGVTLTKTSLAATDAEKFDLHELSYSVAMTATAPGEYKVPGTFRFAVCDEGACYPKKRAVELVLKVQ